MEIKHNVVGWFEIPTINMDRAIKFYETVFGFKIQRGKVGSLDMAWFPNVEKGMGSGGALVYDPDNFAPRDNGVLIYFTAFSGDVAVELARVQAAGGKVIQPKTLITKEIGYMALLLDSEGNRIALHAH
jgi:hypothetical protein